MAYKHVIPLDFASTKSLPETHIWPESDDFYSGSDHLSIPVIDLTDPNATRHIIEACETWGVFELVNHVIPQRLVENVEAQAHRLFALPAERKLKTLRAPGKVSTGYGNPPSQASLPRKLWQEGFTILGSTVDQAKVLWPDHDDHQEFCKTMDDFQKQTRTLAEKLLRTILKSLSIEVNWFDDPSQCQIALQLNSFPPCPNPSQALGLPPHTDSSLLTILHSRTEGLQLFKQELGWFTLKPNPESLVVNLGDMLHMLSNGRFVSVDHRAKVVQKNHRISVALFVWPPVNANITPMLSREFADSGEVPVYRTVTLEEYHVLKSKHSRDTLSVVRN